MTTRSDEPGVRLPDVPRTVTGRQRNKAGRVTYEHRGQQRTTERLVAIRCHEAGYGAFVVPSSIWRIMGTLETLERAHPKADLGELLKRPEIEKTSRPRRGLVEALRAGLTAERLRKLIDRHTKGDVDPAKPGVPDLFVFKKRADGRPYAVRFVEVKRGGSPPERLMPHQLEEIQFLKRIGVKAGVLRLEERWRPAAVEEGAPETPGEDELQERRPSVDEVADAIAPFLDALRGGNDAFRRRERDRARASRQASAEQEKRKARLTVHEGGRS